MKITVQQDDENKIELDYIDLDGVKGWGKNGYFMVWFLDDDPDHLMIDRTWIEAELK